MKTFPLTIIVPVHALNAETSELLAGALRSVATQKNYNPEQVLVVIPAGNADLENQVRAIATEALASEEGPLNWAFVLNDAGSDVAAQINAGVTAAQTTYVTILELDDELGNQYIQEMAVHTEDKPEVEGFLPLSYNIDPQQRLLMYGNEAIWVPKTHEDRPDGLLDAETTETATDLLLSGALLRKSVFTDGFGLKPSIKLTAVNEFYRRVVARGTVLSGMGKVLYLHRMRRPGSYIHELLTGENPMTDTDVNYWVEVAREESAFEIERALPALG